MMVVGIREVEVEEDQQIDLGATVIVTGLDGCGITTEPRFSNRDLALRFAQVFEPPISMAHSASRAG
jgi:hypothetical protein